jgi:hypothetical protein
MNMTIESDVITGPAHWAIALIGGDESGLEADEAAKLNAWCEQIKPWYVVGIVEDQEPYFTWSYDLYGGDAKGGDVIDYIVHKWHHPNAPDPNSRERGA